MKKQKTRHPGLWRLPDGRWYLRTTATCRKTGKLKEKTKTLVHGVTEDEALQALYQLKQQLKHGSRRADQGRRTTVADFAEQWLEAKAARVRPSVATNYASKLSLFILPHLGEHFLNAVEREDVEAWVQWAEQAEKANGEPYAKATVQGWWRVLVQVIRDGCAQYRLSDPTYRVRPPSPRRAPRRETRTLSARQLVVLLDTVRQYFPARYPEAYVLAYTGMRAGECYALKWEDVREADGLLLVSRSVWNQHVDETKTEAPREVALSAEMVEVLRNHRRRMVAAQHIGLSTGLIFPADNGAHRLPQSLHKPLKYAAERLQLPVHVTPQVFRRTFNTLSLAAGVDRIVLRSQMGHSSEEMTERYAGIPIAEKQAALRRLMQLTEAGN